MQIGKKNSSLTKFNNRLKMFPDDYSLGIVAKVTKLISIPTKTYVLLLCLSLSTTMVFSQKSQSPFRVWQLLSWKANLNMRGNYSHATSKTNNVLLEKNSGSSAYAGANLSMHSYIVHPNFMDVHCSGLYNTSGYGASSADLPDYTQKDIINDFNYAIVFFKRQKFHLSTNGGMSSGKSNFERIKRSKYTNKYWSASFDLPNKILPFAMNYSYNKSEQKIIELNQKDISVLQLFSASTSKSFSRFDNNSLSYSHNLNKFNQQDYNANTAYSSSYKTDDLNFSNDINFYLDKKKIFHYNSTISGYHAEGSIVVNHIIIGENLNIKLPKNFNWNNGYSFRTGNQEYYHKGMNYVFFQSFRSTLTHQLFKSLSTNLSYNRFNQKQNTLHQTGNGYSFSSFYNKKIPHGTMTISYIFNLNSQTIRTALTTINISHEEYFLADSLIVVLNQQHVNMQSVIVRNQYGIPYRLYQDYILLDKNPYLEIVRVLGGTIPNKTIVYIDYSFEKPGFFKSTGIGNTIATQVQLFGNLLSLSYSFSKQQFYNVTKSDMQELNYFIRHNAGIRVNYKFIGGGIKYDYNRSSIMPYQSLTYNLAGHKSYKKLEFSVNADVIDMQMNDEVVRRQSISMGGQISYLLLQNINSSASYSYMTSKGRGINVDVQSAGISLNGNFNMLSVRCWTNFYFKRQLNNRTIYNGTYIEVSRFF